MQRKRSVDLQACWRRTGLQTFRVLGCCLWTVIGRNRFNSRVIRGRNAAYPVWSSGLYCHPCGLAFWPVSPAPNVPAQQALLPEHFRWHVWNAGGYVNT